jgi:hypothetical protein
VIDSGEVLVWGYFIDAAGGEKFYSVPLALPQKHAFVDMALGKNFLFGVTCTRCWVINFSRFRLLSNLEHHGFVGVASGDVLYVGPKIGSRGNMPHNCLESTVVPTNGECMRSVVAWEYSAMFLSTDGHIFSWGLNRSNMLCLGRTLSKSDSIIPVPFVGEFQEKRWRSISLSDSWGGAVDGT